MYCCVRVWCVLLNVLSLQFCMLLLCLFDADGETPAPSPTDEAAHLAVSPHRTATNQGSLCGCQRPIRGLAGWMKERTQSHGVVTGSYRGKQLS